MRYCVTFGAVLWEIFCLSLRFCRFYKTKRFSVFTNLVNFDALLRYFGVFQFDFAVFRRPLTPAGTGAVSVAK